MIYIKYYIIYRVIQCKYMYVYFFNRLFGYKI